jgi:hypothetical protein
MRETAARMGVRYRPSWPIAILLVPLMLVVLTLTIALTAAVTNLVGADGQFIERSPAAIAAANRAWTLAVWTLVATIVSLLGWSLWIALVVWNVPALTASWPPNSPIGAFFAAWIPIINFKRPYSVVRGVLMLLTPGRLGPQLIALAWWFLWLTSYFAPFFVVLGSGDRFPTPLAAEVFASRVGTAFLVASGILGMTLVVVIELAQQAALRDRDSVLVGEDRVAQGPA